MIETVCLRFRDITGNDTIAEHSHLIQAKGHCWWGWWRKSTELHWYDELTEINSRLETGPLDVGLFDRSEPSRFFRAVATDCRWARDATIPTPEPENTPEYYRVASVAAWFRLTKIEPLSKVQFELQFGPLPLGHLTFFPVRTGDRQLTLVDTNVVPIIETSMRGDTIMHLSDLHCGADFRFKPSLVPATDLADLLLNDVKRLGRDEGIKVGLIVVSGDLTTRADPHPLTVNDPKGYGPAALTILKRLTDGLGLTETEVVIVPGNHDIPLRDFSPTDYSHENGFKTFLSYFYGRRIAEFMQFFRCRRADDSLVEILTINSAKLRDTALKNFGYVRWAPYDDFLKQIGPSAPKALRVAVLHHHLVPAPRQESPDPAHPEAGMSVTIDTGSVIQGLQSNGFQLALHGHQHVPALTKVARGRRYNGPNVTGLDTPLHIVSGGSAGAIQQRLNTEISDNSYSLLTLKRDGIAVRVRKYNEGLDPEDYMRTLLAL
jgi:3',5'-cyclic AMP phosphodiesterase CpdA